MSEPRLISPMLDNFAMGDPISDRNGVRCCPALEKESDNKYIVKIISSPASQSKLDALILSGAYPDVQSATAYFKELADGIMEEAEVLQKLSKLEGFLSYDSRQMVPMDAEPGYDVYFLSKYRKTLAQLLRNKSMTHLDALNLGLDLCASLAVCRRSGYLYVDLKPENIYLNKESAYRIGDIGFIRLDSLKYASLPDRYRSAYTAPEIADAFSSLNTTMDIYALGLILYQVFNAGQMPVFSEDGSIPAPDYADYEMAEIILKACAAEPQSRWQDPVEMGQALVSYMQRNGAHDTPIIPAPKASVEEEAADSLQAASEDIPAPSGEDAQDAEQPACDGDALDTDSLQPVELSDPDTTDPETDADKSDDSSDEAYALESDSNTDTDKILSEATESEEYDETLPGSEETDIDYSNVSEEVSDILNQADDLISHPTPDPVIPPDPADIVIPDPADIVIAPENAQENTDEDGQDVTLEQDSEADAETLDGIAQTVEGADDSSAHGGVAEDSLDEDVSEFDEDIPVKKKPKRWLAGIIITLSVLIIGAFGYLFYTRYYLQPVNAFTVLENTNGNIELQVDSQIDDEKLFVICTDTYGNQLKGDVTDGRVRFTGLKPDSPYTLQLDIKGFHSLTGNTELTVSTPPLTDIVQFLAVTGTEDGSAILSFTVNGPDSEQWKLSYAAAGEAAQAVTFSGHVYTITGLTLGSEYTFTLTPESVEDFTGINVITHTASKVVKPTKLQITSSMNNKLAAKWAAPEGATISSWTVRCFNDAGFDMTQTVSDTFAEFDGIDHNASYTVEVTAEGMSVSERAVAEANSITAYDIKIDDTDPNSLTVSWSSNGTPENGWIMQYTVDGSSAQKITVTEGNSVVIPTPIPGSLYTLTLQTGDSAAVLGGIVEHKTADAKEFSGYGVSAKNISFSMCKTPKSKNWDRFDLSKSDYTSTFSDNGKASFLAKMNKKYKVSNDKITTLFVIRDKSGNVVTYGSTTAAWKNMWYNNYCELDIPSLPSEAGKYTVTVYFNGAQVHQQSFTISK